MRAALPFLALAQAEPDSAYFYCGTYVGLYTARIGNQNIPAPVDHYRSFLAAVEESICASSGASTISIVHGSQVRGTDSKIFRKKPKPQKFQKKN